MILLLLVQHKSRLHVNNQIVMMSKLCDLEKNLLMSTLSPNTGYGVRVVMIELLLQSEVNKEKSLVQSQVFSSNNVIGFLQDFICL